MHIILSMHAKKRITERKITVAQVRKAIKKPFAILPVKDSKRVRVMAKINSKTLDVIYVLKPRSKYLIVTAVWLKKEDRKVCP